MRTTMTLSANLNCSPFDIFEKEIDEVIMVINFYVELGVENDTNAKYKIENNKAVNKNDGFWDM